MLFKNKNNTFANFVIKHIVTKIVIIVVIIVAYVGYGVIDNMFISRATEKEKKMENLKKSISDYNNKINEYKNLWSQMLQTGDDKRVVSDFTFNKIEKIFNSLPKSFDIKNFEVALNIMDPITIKNETNLDLPKDVNLVVYDFSIEGKFEVETDVYNMIAFLSKNLPGVLIVNTVSIDSGFKPDYIDEMLNVDSLKVKVSGTWFFLSND